ncbi:hypothetical protein [Actinotalea sp. K2]|uniref:hypothetical protein n=1 Tax=Actinotalea sp. K2 TaxID=2939438 RepID=UPI002016E97B|nr:hypothetical protein [Actinotalea sp. K2]MCL3862980.1 hypothetical protein [Actinotalea sp. K2]
MTSRITWTCTPCDTPVDDGKGYLSVDLTAVAEHERAWDELDERKRETGRRGVTASELADMPEHVTWEAAHTKCVPESNTYDIPIDAVRTHAYVIEQTAHMMEKSWIGATNWTSVLRWCALQ